MSRRLHALLLALAPWAGGCATVPPPEPQPGVHDLEGRTVDPLARDASRAVVLVFIDTQCPISNAYAPELRRLAAEYAPRGVAFHLVYADPDRTPAEVRAHLEAFDYGLPAVLDPRQVLARRSHATIVPEAALFDGQRRLAYHGRIDDRFPDFGVQRPVPFQRELCTALDAVLAGEEPPQASVPGVGCAIPPPAVAAR